MGQPQKLTSLYVNGYKSFPWSPPRQKPGPGGKHEIDYGGRQVEFGDVTVLIGANGAGKSNVVSFFQLLNFMMTEALQEFIGREGGARSLLHYGPETTQMIEAVVGFSDDHRRNTYTLALASAAPDTLVFTNEVVEYHQSGYSDPMKSFLGSGQKESKLGEEARGGNVTAKVMLSLLRSCRTYQFHDTSANANIRKSCYIDDSKYLRTDGGNLASFLYRLQDTHPKHFDRIVRTIQQVCPQFGRFELEPTARDSQSILLNWYERHHSGYLMGPHQLSDGTLRFMALATLFLQPPELLPSVIVIDEPELGLHPQATAALAGMINGLAGQTQVILATQSETLVNHFGLDQIRVIEHTRGASHFLDLDPEKYQDWLEDYTTGELWEKNIFGGGPRHE